jgi:rod shape-determining protein MreD
MRKQDPRWLIVFLANLLLWWLVGVLNHHLQRFSFLWLDRVSLHLYVGGLFVVYSALRLDHKHGLIAIVLTGLSIDALEPVPYGTSMILLGFVHATLLYGRRRFPREGAVFGIVVALFANLFLMIALSFLLVGANPRPGSAWLRIFVDLLASQLFLLVITPWFLALQERAMEFAAIHPETGRRVNL